MFTGIITHTGKLIHQTGQLYAFRAENSICKRLGLGSSIAVNGVCLTVCKKPLLTSFSVEVMPETIKRTMIGNLQEDDLVNLELPMTPENFFAGHIVQGHIDGIGFVAGIKAEGNSRLLKITISSEVSKYVVEKGSIAVNGISLTVIKTGKTYFTVGIIAHTWNNTMLQHIKTGDTVNIETDIIAKYLEKLVEKRA